jgi:paxillin
MVQFQAQVQHDYTAEDESELSLISGELVIVLKTLDNGWWLCESSDGSNGWAPGAYMEIKQPSAAMALNFISHGDIPEDRELVMSIRKRLDPFPNSRKIGGDDGCVSCQREIVEEYVLVKKGKVHKECFYCYNCQKSLLDCGYLEEEGELLCEVCYQDKYAPKCAHCKHAILEEYVSALGKIYHPEHFVCKVCKMSLGDQEFFEYQGGVFCQKDFVEHCAEKCSVCKKGIFDDRVDVVELNQSFHESCFVCSHDKHPISNDESFHIHEGKIICHAHFLKLFSYECVVCKLQIEGDYVTVKGNNYHSACFACEECKVNLIKGNLTFLGNRLLCNDCGKKLRATKAYAYQSKIAPSPSSNQAKTHFPNNRQVDNMVSYGNISGNKAVSEMKPDSLYQENRPKSGSLNRKRSDSGVVMQKSPQAEKVDCLSYAGPFYSYSELKNNFPASLLSAFKEMYLDDKEFSSIFKISKAEFYKAKEWKQKSLKKEKGLF